MVKRNQNPPKPVAQVKSTSRTRSGTASKTTTTTGPSETTSGDPSSRDEDPPLSSVVDENFHQSRTQSTLPTSDDHSNRKAADGMGGDNNTARQPPFMDPLVDPDATHADAPAESPPPVYDTGPVPTPIPPMPFPPRVHSPDRSRHTHRDSGVNANAPRHPSRHSSVSSGRRSPPRPHVRVPLFNNPAREADAQTPDFQYLRDQLNRFHYAYTIGTITMADYADQHHQLVSRAEDMYDDLRDARKTAKDGKRRRLSTSPSSTHRSKKSNHSIDSEFLRAADESRARVHQDNIRHQKPGESSREDPVHANANAPAPNPTPTRPASAQSVYTSMSGGSAPKVIPWDITPYILTPSNPMEEEYDELFHRFMLIRNFCTTTEKRHLKEIQLLDEFAEYQLIAQPAEADVCRIRVNTLGSHMCEQYIEILERLDVLDAQSTSAIEKLFPQIHDPKLYKAFVDLLRYIKSLRKDIAFLNDERRNALLRDLGYPPGPIDTRRHDVVYSEAELLSKSTPQQFSTFFFPKLTEVSIRAGNIPYTDLISPIDPITGERPPTQRLNPVPETIPTSTAPPPNTTAAGNPDPAGDPSEPSDDGNPPRQPPPNPPNPPNPGPSNPRPNPSGNGPPSGDPNPSGGGGGGNGGGNGRGNRGGDDGGGNGNGNRNGRSGNRRNGGGGGGDPDPGDGGDPSHHSDEDNEDAPNRPFPPRRRFGPFDYRPSQEPDTPFRRPFPLLPNDDFPGINTLHFNDENQLWIDFLVAYNRSRRGIDGTTYGVAKSSATAKVRSALRRNLDAPEGKSLLAQAGVKAEIDSSVVFTGKDADPASFEKFIVSVLEYLSIANLLGPGSRMDITRIQFLGLRLRGDALEWYQEDVSGSILDGNWTFLKLVQGLENQFLKNSTFDTNKALFERFRQLPDEKIFTAYQRLQRYSQGMLYEASPYDIKYRFYWGIREEIRCELAHDNISPDKEAWSIRDMLKQAINIEKGFDSAKTPKQLIQNSSSSSKPKASNPTSAANNSNNRDSSGRFRPHDRKNDSQPRKPDTPRPDNRLSNPQNRSPSHRPRAPFNNRPNNNNNRPSNKFTPNQPSPLRNETRDKSKDQCHDCNQYGHWAGDKECKGKVRAHRIEFNPSPPSTDSRSHHSAHSEVSDIADTALPDPQNDDFDIDMNYADYGDDYYAQSQHSAHSSSGSNQFRSAGASYFELDDDSIRAYQAKYKYQTEDEPLLHRARFKIKPGFRARPTGMPNATISGYIPINGQRAHVLIDCGSEGDLIAPRFVTVAEIKAHRLVKPIGIQLAVSGSRSQINFGCDTKMTVGGSELSQYFDICNLDYYDAIIGMPTLRRLGLLIDCGENTVRMRNGSYFIDSNNLVGPDSDSIDQQPPLRSKSMPSNSKPVLKANALQAVSNSKANISYQPL